MAEDLGKGDNAKRDCEIIYAFFNVRTAEFVRNFILLLHFTLVFVATMGA